MLKALGFGPTFLASFQMLFNAFMIVLTLDMVHSAPIILFISIIHGCPLAPSLYVLVAKAFGYINSQ